MLIQTRRREVKKVVASTKPIVPLVPNTITPKIDQFRDILIDADQLSDLLDASGFLSEFLERLIELGDLTLTDEDKSSRNLGSFLVTDAVSFFNDDCIHVLREKDDDAIAAMIDRAVATLINPTKIRYGFLSDNYTLSVKYGEYREKP